MKYMQRGRHTRFSADDGIDAPFVLKSNLMDSMILSVMMPYFYGFSVCKMTWKMSNIPIGAVALAKFLLVRQP